MIKKIGADFNASRSAKLLPVHYETGDMINEPTQCL